MIQSDYPVDKVDGRSLRSGFLRNAARSRQAPALTVGDDVYAYQNLEHKARVWARVIVESLGRPARRVGVFAYRSEVSYVGVLAALCSGACFVPLNRTFPVERTRLMSQMADLDALICDQTSAAQLNSVLAGWDGCPVILVPDQDTADILEARRKVVGRSELDGYEPLDSLPPVVPEEPAYLLFTSGSTGTPKGVAVTHTSVLHFIDAVTRRYGITSQDRFTQCFDQTFDLSIFDLFVAWESGGCVCAMQPLDLLAPVRFVAKHRITIWFSVPSLPALMRKKKLLNPSTLPGLRWSLFCGEALPRSTAEAWQEAAPNSILENLYGPTELTIACFVYRWDQMRSPELCVNDIVPIGRPLEGLGAVVTDETLKPVTDGEPGELLVSGPQTAPGYWRDAAKTAERFVYLPYCDVRFYRTGDRVRRLQNGDYVYLGRTDDQIKVLGHRVELGEIEATLSKSDGVIQAVAIGWPLEDGTAQGVVAFVCGNNIDLQRLQSRLRGQLPEYMVPRQILVEPEMPLNSNGKVDRKALRGLLETGSLATRGYLKERSL
jgi:amino acid adenylation domain-containing protein